MPVAVTLPAEKEPVVDILEPVIAPEEVMGLLNSNLSPLLTYVIVASAPSIVRPEPLAADAFAAPSERTMFLSSKVTAVELIVVWTPST